MSEPGRIERLRALLDRAESAVLNLETDTLLEALEAVAAMIQSSQGDERRALAGLRPAVQRLQRLCHVVQQAMNGPIGPAPPPEGYAPSGEPKRAEGPNVVRGYA